MKQKKDGIKKIAVITAKPSDFTSLLGKSAGIKIQLIKPSQILKYNLDDYSAICILGGADKQLLELNSYERIKIEEQVQKGKKVFAEFVSSIYLGYSDEPVSTRYERMVYVGNDYKIPGIEPNDILDDQCNLCSKPYFKNNEAKPVLVYGKHIKSHSKAVLPEKEIDNVNTWALWHDLPNLLVCSFCICNFNRARFAPINKWRAVIKYIIEWLVEKEITLDNFEKPYSLIVPGNGKELTKQIEKSFRSAINWFKNSGILIKDGKRGVHEGLGTEIYPDGKQKLLKGVRTDCVGETALAYFMNYLLKGDKQSITISNNLSSYCFDSMQIKDGLYKGMIRWTERAWGVCYADDVARVLIPQLLKCLYGETDKYLQECKDALQFLVNTTGTDGTRVMRTDLCCLDENTIKKISSEPANLNSAHYNAYYLGTLLLCYKMTGEKKFLEVGVKGLESIMSVYPDTVREQSETEELCRLVMPLAWLYWATGEPKHKDYLYRVTKDLQRLKHSSGGYLEWDTGYKANCSKTEGGECSLLTNNGDPVVDMLYSINWLPLGFMQAYFVTKDEYFKELWVEIAKFMAGSQIHSKNRMINGGWTRGFDVELMEVFGLPNDIGWGPNAMESGWTVAEIASGLAAGLLSDKLIKFY